MAGKNCLNVARTSRRSVYSGFTVGHKKILKVSDSWWFLGVFIRCCTKTSRAIPAIHLQSPRYEETLIETVDFETRGAHFKGSFASEFLRKTVPSVYSIFTRSFAHVSEWRAQEES